MTRMLVVEDQDLMRSTVMEIVETEFANSAVHGAGTLDIALKSISQTRYDLIVLDPGLPAVDPHTPADRKNVVNSIRAAAPNAAIIILTGADDQNEAVSFRSANVAAYIAKTGLSRNKLRQVFRSIDPSRYPVRLSKPQEGNRVEISLAKLSSREREVAEIILANPDDRKRKDVYEEAAGILDIEADTVRTYVKRIRRKLPNIRAFLDDE